MRFSLVHELGAALSRIVDAQLDRAFFGLEVFIKVGKIYVLVLYRDPDQPCCFRKGGGIAGVLLPLRISVIVGGGFSRWWALISGDRGQVLA